MNKRITVAVRQKAPIISSKLLKTHFSLLFTSHIPPFLW